MQSNWGFKMLSRKEVSSLEGTKFIKKTSVSFIWAFIWLIESGFMSFRICFVWILSDNLLPLMNLAYLFWVVWRVFSRPFFESSSLSLTLPNNCRPYLAFEVAILARLFLQITLLSLFMVYSLEFRAFTVPPWPIRLLYEQIPVSFTQGFIPTCYNKMFHASFRNFLGINLPHNLVFECDH